MALVIGVSLKTFYYFNTRTRSNSSCTSFNHFLKSAKFRTPPEALTCNSLPTVCFINATSSAVAPPAKPVDVLTKSAPAARAISQALTFSSSVNNIVSMITLTKIPLAAPTTPSISFSHHHNAHLLMRQY